MKRGDTISLTAVVEEIRSDGIVVLTIPATTSLLPAVVVTTRDLLSCAQPPRPPAPARATLPLGAIVLSRKGERGEVIHPDPGVYRIQRLRDRADCLMIQWEGRSLPTWEAPEDVEVDESST